MALPLPTSLSPSKVTAFKDCALAFRFSAIDRLPEPPSVPATKGTLVHRALELLHLAPGPERTIEQALRCLDTAREEMAEDPDYTGLALDEAAAAAFHRDAQSMVRRYFEVEDPTTVRAIGLELRLEAELGSLKVRGIIDRLELDAEGGLVITDYKTGRVPMQSQEQAKLGGVHFYAYLCHRVLGVLPSAVRLMYLGSTPEVITTRPTEQSVRGLEKRVGAIWAAVERACEREDFRPNPGRLCDWCAHRTFCPAFGGDPSQAAAAAAAAAALTTGTTVTVA